MDLGPIDGDFQAVSEDEYEDLMMEVDIENMEANVVEISDEESNDDDGGNAEVDEADEIDAKMVVFGLDAPGMGQSGEGFMARRKEGRRSMLGYSSSVFLIKFLIKFY